MSTVDFAEWLLAELELRKISAADLARKSEISKATISRILKREREAKPETLAAIARGLKLPKESVYQKAGLLPPKPKDQAEIDDLVYRYGLLSPEQKDDVRSLIDFLLWRGAPAGVVEGYADPLPARETEPGIKKIEEFDEEKFEKALRMLAPAYRKRGRREDYPQLLRLYQKTGEQESGPTGR